MRLMNSHFRSRLAALGALPLVASSPPTGAFQVVQLNPELSGVGIVLLLVCGTAITFIVLVLLCGLRRDIRLRS